MAHPVGDTQPEQGNFVRGVKRQGTRVCVDRLVEAVRGAPDCQGVAQGTPGAGVGFRLGRAAQQGRIRGTGGRRSRHLRVVGERFVEELGFERFRAWADSAHDAVLVDRNDDRDSRRFEKIDRVVEDRPAELLPLGEQPAAVGMLLLGHAQHEQPPLRHPLASRFVPDWHVPPAAHSPGGELNQQHLLAAKA